MGGRNSLFCAAECFVLYKLLFVYFWLLWVFLAAGGRSVIVSSGGYLLAVVSRLLTVRLLLWHRLKGAWASVVATRELSCCGAWAKLTVCGILFSLSGIKPVSPALAGRFLTARPLGNPCRMLSSY